jgi:hypothetical protein
MLLKNINILNNKNMLTIYLDGSGVFIPLQPYLSGWKE